MNRARNASTAGSATFDSPEKGCTHPKWRPEAGLRPSIGTHPSGNCTRRSRSAIISGPIHKRDIYKRPAVQLATLDICSIPT